MDANIDFDALALFILDGTQRASMEVEEQESGDDSDLSSQLSEKDSPQKPDHFKRS